jgi:phage shock protein PspC (stress-responsive transcriptional regulator)
MELENEHEALIKTYLRDVEVQMDQSIPPDTRSQFLDRLRFRIDQELKAAANDHVEIRDVQAVLDRFGPPSAQAAKLIPLQRHSTSGFHLDVDHAVWLGVCGGVADALGMERRAIRALTILLGVSGPFILMVYLGCYFYLYYTAAPGSVPKIDYPRVIKYFFLAVAGILVLHYLAYYTLYAVEYGHERILNRDLPQVGDWGWIMQDLDSMYFTALFCAVPLAILSALPLANGWSYSLKRVTQAAVALYGVALAFGIASYLVGMILNYVQQFGEGADFF